MQQYVYQLNIVNVPQIIYYDEKNKEWAKREGVRYVLNDASGEVGRSYGAKTTRISS